MNQENYNQLNEEFFKALSKDQPESRHEMIRQTVNRQMSKVVDEGKLMTLSADEVGLLFEYRRWRCNPKADETFYFRKQNP